MEYLENPMRYNISTRSKERFILRSIVPKKDEKILDVGCGIGYFTSLLAEKGDVYGIDVEKESLKFAKDEKKAEFVVGDSLELPFKDSTFDWILSSDVLEHVMDEDKFMKEMSRVIAREGKFVLTVPSVEGILKVSMLCHEKGHEFHYKEGYKKNELVKLLEKNGFVVIKINYNMAFFSRIIMEITKFVYNFMNPSFEKQSDVFKTKNSLIFKIYKKLFFILLTIDYFDSFLTKILKGSGVMVLAMKR